jgi:hypothetical protein
MMQVVRTASPAHTTLASQASSCRFLRKKLAVGRHDVEAGRPAAERCRRR